MNPFSPFAAAQPAAAPQMQGVQAPNVAMQDKPSMMEQIGPKVFEKAMDSDMASSMGSSMVEGAKGVWGSMVSPAAAPPIAGVAAPVVAGSTAPIAAGIGSLAGALGPLGIPVMLAAGLAGGK